MDIELLAYRDEEPYRMAAATNAGGSDGPGVTRRQIKELIDEILRRAAYPTGPLSFGKNYRYQPGDLLDVAVHGRPEFSGRTEIRADGVIVLPTVKVNVYLKNQTPKLARDRIAAALFPKYLRHKPFVSVELLRSAQRFVYVFGEVARPGQYLFGDRPITVLTAYLAGNDAVNIDSLVHSARADSERATPAATERTRAALRRALRPRLDKVVLITPDPAGPVRVIVDLDRVRGGDIGADPIVRPGQIVYVPSAAELKDSKSLGWRLVFGKEGRKIPGLEKLEAAAGIGGRRAPKRRRRAPKR